MTDVDASTTATAMRAAFRSVGFSDRHVKCLQDCVALLHASQERKEQQLLEVIADHFGAPHGVLLGYASGKLRAVSSVGGAAITSSRQPVKSSLAPFLKWPCKPFMRVAPEQAWLFYVKDPGFEWLIPLPWDGAVVGVLSLAGFADQPLPGERDKQLMTVVAALLAGTVAGNLASRAGRRSRVLSEELSLLSPREKEVMSLLPRGMSNARIAANLGVAPGTVKTHVERILGKLQLEDRAQAAARAVELKLGDSGLPL